MKKFNIFGVHRKIRVLGTGGRVFTKNQYLEGLAWIIYRFKGKPGKKEECGVFEGWGIIPQCTL